MSDQITISSQSNYTYNYFGGDVIRFNTTSAGATQNGIIKLDSWSDDTDLSEWLEGKISETLGTTEVSVDITASDFVNYAEFTVNFEGTSEVGNIDAWDELANQAFYSDAWNNSAMFAFGTSASENWSYTRSANSFEISHELSIASDARSQQDAPGGKGKLTSEFDGATNLNNDDTSITNKSQLAVGTPEMASTTSFARKVFGQIFNVNEGPAGAEEIYIETPLDGLTALKGADIGGYFDNQTEDEQWGHNFSESYSKGGNSTTYTQTFTAKNPNYDDLDLDVTKSYQASRSNGYLYCTEEGTLAGLGSNSVSNTKVNTDAVAEANKRTQHDYIQGLLDFWEDVKLEADKEYLKDPDDETQPFIVRNSTTTYSHLSETAYSRTITNDPSYSGLLASGTGTGATGTGLCRMETTVDSSLDGCYSLETYSTSFQGITKSGDKDNPVITKDRYDLALKAYEEKRGKLRSTGNGTLAATSLKISSKDAQIMYTTSFSEDPAYSDAADKEGGYKLFKKTTTTNSVGSSPNYYYPLSVLESSDKNTIVNGSTSPPSTTAHAVIYVAGTGQQAGVPNSDAGAGETSNDEFFEKALEDAKDELDSYESDYYQGVAYEYTIDPTPTLKVSVILVK